MSPSGAESYKKHRTVISARRSASSAGVEGLKYFKIEDGQTARIRILETDEELTYAQTHRIKNQYGGFSDVICLDQENDGTSCPACQSDSRDISKRSTKGFINIIWRGNEDEGYVRAPVYKLNDKGYFEKDQNKQKIIIGMEDSVWLWKCSNEVFDMIVEKGNKYKGIMSRDLVVSRKGALISDTKYAIEPAVMDGGAEGMTIADANLASKKFDVVSLTTPGTYDEMVALLNGQNSAGNNLPGSTFQREPTQNEVFNSPMRSSAFQR